MISRTGISRARPSCLPHRPSRGFTLIELLVVIAIIGVLTGILMPVLFKARSSAKKRWAMKELSELRAVISVYHQDQSGYPPDTQDWGAAGGNDELNANKPKDDFRSINRYLGRKVTNWRGEVYPAYMSMSWDRVINRDPVDRAGVFLDPYEEPYELDSMHMIPPDPSDPGSGYKQCGWPYILANKNTPTLQEKLNMVLDYKFISNGEDTLTVDYPFDMGSLLVPAVTKRPGFAKDDVCSWR